MSSQHSVLLWGCRMSGQHFYQEGPCTDCRCFVPLSGDNRTCLSRGPADAYTWDVHQTQQTPRDPKPEPRYPDHGEFWCRPQITCLVQLSNLEIPIW